MSKHTREIALVLCLLLPPVLATAGGTGKKQISEEALARAHELLATAATYSEKTPYSPSVETVLLGYRQDGTIDRGIALRAFKTYEWVTAVIVVEPKNGTFVVTHAEIPDIGRIANEEKQRKVTAAITSIAGRTVRTETEAYKTIDAVTGATRYHKRIYTYFDTMAKALVAEIAGNPDWPRKPTQQTGVPPHAQAF